MLLRSRVKIVLLLCTLVLLSLVFSACSIGTDSEKSRQLCEEFTDHVIGNDYDGAYAMVSDVCTKNEFDTVWDPMRNALEDSSTYEIKQTGWHKSLNDGITRTTVAFEIVTNDEKICQISIVTTDNTDGIAGLHFLDSTEFAESTEFVPILNIVLIGISIVSFAFIVWMFVDCIRRPIKRKVLWAIIILIGFGLSLTLGAETFGFNFKVALLIAVSSIIANRAALSVTVTAVFPVGAIVYFFMRKKLTLPLPEETVAEPPAVPADEANASDTTISDDECSST